MSNPTPRGASKGNHTGYWSYPAHREEAKRLYLLGLSATQVSAALARTFPDRQAPSRNGVIGLVWRLGLTRDERKRATPKAPKPPKPPKPVRVAKPTHATLQARERVMKPTPVPASKPVLLTGLEKPWTQRKFGECAFPSAGEGADTLSCCQPTRGETYCAAHRAILYTSPDPQPPRRKHAKPEPTFRDVEAA